jgi:hypothetical protein
MAYTLLVPGAGLLTQTLRSGVNLGAGLGVTPAVAGGHSFTNDGNVLLYIASTHTAAITVTISAPNLVDTYGNLAIAGLQIVIPAGNVTAQRILTPVFPRTIYNQSDGTVHIDYNIITALNVAAVQQFREPTQ